MARFQVWFTGTVLALCAAGVAQAQSSDYTATPVLLAAAARSDAGDARAYRRDGAQYIYEAYAHRIYRGKLPPLIHAVVVVETELDEQGRVIDVTLVRIPSHAPEVAVAVRDMIRQISPLPAPVKLGGVKYTDIWLVDKSGRFQLDTLTEGQMGEEALRR